MPDDNPEHAEQEEQPTSPLEQLYETEYLPWPTAEIRQSIDPAIIHAWALIEAVDTLKKLEKEIDSNDLYAAEEKERLKQRVRQEFDGILGNQKNRKTEHQTESGAEGTA
jgi:hypothetical protein